MMTPTRIEGTEDIVEAVETEKGFWKVSEIGTGLASGKFAIGQFQLVADRLWFLPDPSIVQLGLNEKAMNLIADLMAEVNKKRIRGEG